MPLKDALNSFIPQSKQEPVWKKVNKPAEEDKDRTENLANTHSETRVIACKCRLTSKNELLGL